MSTLPAPPSPAPPAAPASPAPHLLVVDDEEIVLVALRQTLTQLGYRVTTASDAIQGLGKLREREYAAVISDHQMPTLTGLEFLAQVREIQPDASRILITAVLNLSTVIEAINQAEIFRFLIKPWEREELIGTVKAAVERHAVRRRQAEQLARALRENESLQTRVRELETALAATPPAPRPESGAAHGSPGDTPPASGSAAHRVS